MLPRPLRVALFSGNFNYTTDGATRALGRLVDHLREAEGAKVRIYSPTAPGTASDDAGELVPIPSVSLPGRPEYRLAMGLNGAARRDLASFAPDVIHLSTPDILGFQAQAFARRRGLPVVASLHTRFETYPAYYGVGWLGPVLEAVIRRFYEGCDYVLAPTAELARVMATGRLDGRMRVWGRGVDRSLFSPALRDLDWRRAQGLADDDVVLLFFGRIVLEKGPALFAEALDEIRRAEPRVRALVVGEGPARPWLMQRLPDAVFTGHLSGRALGRAVASADILLNPSATEAFGNVNLEAMASGLAIVSADMPNSRALMDHGRSGLLCEPADTAAYVEAALDLLRDEGRRRALGVAAFEASAAHSWPAALASVVETYREALGGGRSSGRPKVRERQPALAEARAS